MYKSVAVVGPFLAFFANYKNIFHKIEVQTVILTDIKDLNSNEFLFHKIAKKMKMEIFLFYVITFEPIRI